MGKVVVTDSYYKCDQCGVTSKERDSMVWGQVLANTGTYPTNVFYKKIFCSDLCASSYTDEHTYFQELDRYALVSLFKD